MAQYNKFINANIAPKGAKRIGVYNSRGIRVGQIPLGVIAPSEEEPLYKFGLLSDIHVDTTDYNYASYLNSYPYSDEGEGDFRRALTWLTEKENVDMICACGDMSQQGTTAEYAMPQSVIAECLPSSKNIPFYTCTGNHDTKTAGGNNFGNYFLRSFETGWTGMTNFERSTGFTESFCFDKVTTAGTDHFVFFSMYTYSLGTTGNPYNTNDINWLTSKLSGWGDDRVFIFTHLFFPDYAGNLGRVDGSGGIYPVGNWLQGTQLTSLENLFKSYPHTVWFSGHSHWKWDLQKYQKNINVARYGNNGAWSVHVPSCALPIDSSYTDLNQETSANRVEKPLESQGGVVYVYPNKIVLHGIDFNINASQSGDTTQGYEGDEYVSYLPIACYNLYTDGTESIDISGQTGSSEIITVNNIFLVKSKNYDAATISDEQIGDDSYIDFRFNNNSTGIILSTDNMTSNMTAVQMNCDEIKVYSVASNGVETEQSNADTEYLGWLIDYDSDSNASVYSLGTSFNAVYGFSSQGSDTYEVYGYGDYQANGTNATTLNRYGVQFNVSSKFGNSGTTKWTTTGTFPDDFTIHIRIKNLHATPIYDGSSSGSTDSGSSATSTYLQKANFETNTSKGSPSVDTYIQNLDNDYVAISFDSTSTGFWVSPSNLDTSKTATLVVDDIKCYSGLNTTTGTTISLPSNVGFYNGTNYSGTNRYQIVSGFQPSMTETNANGRMQFQTSSSYAGGSITIVMKVKVTYS